jgi:hypothetical protein
VESLNGTAQADRLPQPLAASQLCCPVRLSCTMRDADVDVEEREQERDEDATDAAEDGREQGSDEGVGEAEQQVRCGVHRPAVGVEVQRDSCQRRGGGGGITASTEAGGEQRARPQPGQRRPPVPVPAKST